MKKIQKVITSLLAIVMVLMLSVPAFAAADGQGDLTVNVNDGNTLKGQTLSVYQLFELKDGSYQVNPIYEASLKQVLGLDDTATSGDIYTAVKDYHDIQEFANKFAAEAVKGNANPTKSEKIDTDERSHIFTGLNYGYYLVYQTGTLTLQASLVNLNDTTKDVNLKGKAPSIDKVADKETVEIGNVVTYTITGTIPDTTNYAEYVYIIHDTLSAGLDFVADKAGNTLSNSNMNVSVKIGSLAEETKQATLSVDKKTMDLDLSEWIREPGTQTHKGETFTVTYYAKVNSNAVIQNKNSASLEYGNDPSNKTTTVPKEVLTPTYPLDINKIIKGTTTMLAGATFRIYRDESDARAALADLENDTKAIKVTGANGKYTVAENQNTETNMDMVTVKNPITMGVNLHLNGLAAGEYWLVETKAPDGYNKVTTPIKITITKGQNADGSDWTISKDNGAAEDDRIIDIENSTGTILPGTGGMGTTIFTIVGIVMIVGIAISFVVSKRKFSY